MELFRLLGTIAIDSSEANSAIDDTTGKAEQSEGKITGAFKKIGAAVATFFAIDKIKDFGIACVKASDDMKNAMNGFAASTGISTESLEGYEDVLESIYKNNYGDSFDDIAESMATVKQQMGELGTDELEKITTDAIILRDTFEFDVNESVRSAQMLMDQFGLSSTEAYNLIAQGAQNGLNKNGDLLDILTEYSVQFADMGYSAEDMFNMLANGAEAGSWSIDKLGDAAKEFNIRMSDGTAKDAVEALGFSWEKVSEKWEAGGDKAAEVMNMLLNEMDGIEDSVEGYNIGVQMFGTMWEDMGYDALLSLSQVDGQINVTKDALASIDSIKYDSLGSALEGLKRKFEMAVMKPLGDALIPVVQGAINIIDSFASHIDLSADGISGFATKALGMFSPEFLENAQRASDRLLMFGQRLGETSVDTFSGKLSGLQGMFSAFGEVIQPIVENYILVFMQGLENVTLTIETVVLPIISGLIDVFVSLATSIAENIAPAVKDISDKWTEMCGLISDYYTESILPVIEGFIEMVGELWAENQDKINAIGELFGVVFELIGKIFDYFYTVYVKGIILPAIELIATWVNDNMEQIKATFQAAFDFIGGIVKFFVALFKGDWQGMWEAVKTILQSGYEFIKNVFNLIRSFMYNICAAILSKVKEIFENIRLAIVNKINQAKASVTTVFTNIKNTISEKLTAAKQIVSDIFDNIKKSITDKIEAAKKAVTDTIEKIKSAFNFEWKLPDIKLPHIKIDGEWSFNPPKVPSFSIEWYKDGGIMLNPTLFGFNPASGKAMVGGEAGAEAIAPIDTLQKYVAEAIDSRNEALIDVLMQILKAIVGLDDSMANKLYTAMAGLKLQINDREFARLVKGV